MTDQNTGVRMTSGGEVDVDSIQQKLGNGSFQFLTFFILGLIYSRGAWHVFGIMFLAGDPGHKCALPDLAEEHLFNDSASLYYGDTNAQTLLVPVETVTVGESESQTHNQRKPEEAERPKIDLGSSMLYAFQGDSVMVGKSNWTADTCIVSYETVNGSVVTLSSECPYGWSYGSQFETTVLSEWNLVCGRNYLVELSITVFMIGATVGAMLILPLADRFGRKSVMFACLLTQTVVGSATAFVNNYILFTALRFLVGMLNIGVGLSSFVLMTEMFPAQQRTVVSIAFQIFWAVGVMTVAGFGHLVRSWRHLELLLSLPNLLALPCYWLFPESVPWLISRKRWTDARAAVSKIARVNGRENIDASALLPVPSSDHDDPSPATPLTLNGQQHRTQEAQDGTDSLPSPSTGGREGGQQKADGADAREETEAKRMLGNGAAVTGSAAETSQLTQLQSFTKLFRNKRMRLYCFVMFFLFFVNSLGYFGISFSVPVLHGDPFVNLCILGAVEIPADIICIIVSQRMGRRYPNAAFLLLCGIANVVALFTPDHLAILKLAFVMLGKFAVTAAYSTVYLYSAEIFPTAVRNQAMGMSSAFENVGSIVAPFIVLAAKSLPQLPLAVFGALSISGAALSLLLPETHNRPLPQTVDEITTWG